MSTEARRPSAAGAAVVPPGALRASARDTQGQLLYGREISDLLQNLAITVRRTP